MYICIWFLWCQSQVLVAYLISITTGPAHLGVSRMMGVTSHELAGSVLLGRWASTVELFGRVSSSQHTIEHSEPSVNSSQHNRTVLQSEPSVCRPVGVYLEALVEVKVVSVVLCGRCLGRRWGGSRAPTWRRREGSLRGRESSGGRWTLCTPTLTGSSPCRSGPIPCCCLQSRLVCLNPIPGGAVSGQASTGSDPAAAGDV